MKEEKDAAANYVSRVDSLEKRVTSLGELPARIDDFTSQVSQLRTEMRVAFPAVRAEMGAGFAAIADKTDRLEAKSDSLEAKTEGLATQMRVLHEEVIARIALLQEGLSGATKRRSAPRSQNPSG